MSPRWTSAVEMVRRGFGTHSAEEVDLGTIRRNAVADILAPIKRFPQQQAVFQRFLDTKQMALCCPRRSGKTEVWRVVLARMVARDSYVVCVIAETLSLPTKNFLEADDKQSMMDEIKMLGLQEFCKVDRPSKAIETIRFDWGSALHVREIGHERSVAKIRGTSANLFWFDEAQDLTHIGYALRKAIRPMLADHGGQVLLTGTPGFAVGSYFFEAFHGPDWEHGTFFPWDNPFFGADDATRWNRLLEGAILSSPSDYGLNDDDVARLKSLTRDQRIAIATDTIEDEDLATWVEGLDRTLSQEFLGRWARGGSQYVYNWHSESIYWAQVEDNYARPLDGLVTLPACAPTSTDIDAVIAARVAALPTYTTPWRVVLAADPGTPNGPSGSATVVIVYNHSDPAAYCLYDHVSEDADINQVLADCATVASSLTRAGVEIDVLVGDFAGVGVGDVMWNEALAAHLEAPIAIEMAVKKGKYQQIHAMNLALSRGVLKVLSGDRLDAEGRNLRWLNTAVQKPAPDKWRPVTLPDGRTLKIGDHALDALRYGLAFVPIRSALHVAEKTLAEQRSIKAREARNTKKFLRKFGRR